MTGMKSTTVLEVITNDQALEVTQQVHITCLNSTQIMAMAVLMAITNSKTTIEVILEGL